MRLIDADKLYPDTFGKGRLAVSQSQIADAPTVQAVPIEVLDKIRAEIEELADADGYGDYQLGFSFGLMMAMEIIDKYRGSEVEDGRFN